MSKARDLANAAALYAPLINPTFTKIGGDEGGEIRFAKPDTNTTLAADVTFDSYQDKLRIFESGGNVRGAYLNLAGLSNGVGSELVASPPQSGNSGKYLSTNGSVTSWSAPGGMTLLNAGGTAMSGASTSVSIDSTGYNNLEIFIKDAYSNTNDTGAFLRINGDSGNNYGYNVIRFDGGPSVAGLQQNNAPYAYYIFNNIPSNNTTLLKGNSHITLFQPTATSNHSIHWQSISGQNNGLQSSTVGSATYDASAAVTSISIHCGGTATWSGGTIYVYGVK